MDEEHQCIKEVVQELAQLKVEPSSQFVLTSCLRYFREREEGPRADGFVLISQPQPPTPTPRLPCRRIRDICRTRRTRAPGHRF